MVVEAAMQQVYMDWCTKSPQCDPLAWYWEQQAPGVIRLLAAKVNFPAALVEETITLGKGTNLPSVQQDAKEQLIRALQWENKVLRDRLERVRAALGDE